MNSVFDGIHLDLSIAWAALISRSLQYKLIESEMLSEVGKQEYTKIIDSIESAVLAQSGHPISYWKV